MRHASLWIGCLLIALLVALTAPAGIAKETKTSRTTSTPDDKPLPRIISKDGKFIERATGKEFRPRGFNYIRLVQPGTDPKALWHGNFHPKFYDAAQHDAALADMEQNGFNIVRVFIDQLPGSGVIESTEATTLSPKYMDNFCDFLVRARRHHIYVIPSLLFVPNCKRYTEAEGLTPEDVKDLNKLYLTQGLIDAKARYLADFITVIKHHSPTLLSTVFAYELDNETHLLMSEPPFSKTSGTFKGINGKTYDLASEDQLQALADDHLKLWANACVDAAHKVDPLAMVSTNVFTPRAVGRSGPARLRHDKTPDVRFPARPLALADTKLAYLDIHLYSQNREMYEGDLKSIEWDALKAECAKQKKPLIMGEFGPFKQFFKSPAEAAAYMARHCQSVLDLGFVGFMYWTYDCHEQDDLIWHAKAGQGEVFKALKAVR